MQPFAYFQDPEHPLSTWRAEPKACDLCGVVTGGFDGPYYGRSKIDRVCEPCLRAGRLVDRGSAANAGTAAVVRRQLAVLHPAWSDDQRASVAKERTRILDHATPHLVTWQDLDWPAHCGDYATFIEELGQPEIRQLAGQEDPATWFTARAEGAGPDVWDAVRTTSARERPRDSHDLTVYRFDCRGCGTVLVHWDCS